mgnify:FL=1
MYGPKLAAAVVIGNASLAYQLIGKLGTVNQGKVAIQGLPKPIPFKGVGEFQKDEYVAAVLGTTTIPIPASPAAGDDLIINVIGVQPSRPETDAKVFVNASIGPNESLTQAQWGARVVAAFNGNETASQMFTASYSAGVVTFTQVTALVGQIFVKSNVATIVTTVVSNGSKNKGFTAAQVTAMIADLTKDYQINTIGTYASTDEFDAYTIVVENSSIMNPFGFKENKPETYLILVDTTYTTWEADLEAIFSMTAANFDVAGYSGYGGIVDATFADSGDLFTKAAHGFVEGQPVYFGGITSTTGFTDGMVYFVKYASSSTFQLALTSGGAAIAGTTNGTAAKLCAVSGGVAGGDWTGDATAEELLAPRWIA